MAVKIRLRRMGQKHAPFYRVVVADSRSPRDGKFIETIGTYDPMQKGTNYEFKMDRIEYWLSTGAQPSETVYNLIKKARRAAEAEAEAAEAEVEKAAS